MCAWSCLLKKETVHMRWIMYYFYCCWEPHCNSSTCAAVPGGGPWWWYSTKDHLDVHDCNWAACLQSFDLERRRNLKLLFLSSLSPWDCVLITIPDLPYSLLLCMTKNYAITHQNLLAKRFVADSIHDKRGKKVLKLIFSLFHRIMQLLTVRIWLQVFWAMDTP